MLDKHPLCEQEHPLVVRNSDHGKFFGCLTFPEISLAAQLMQPPY